MVDPRESSEQTRGDHIPEADSTPSRSIVPATILMIGGHAGQNHEPISGGRRYTTSKLCTIMYAYEMDRQLRRSETSIGAMAYDPGFIPETGMGRGAPAFFRSRVGKFLMRTIGVTMGQMPFSGESLAALAADAKFVDGSGKYFHSKNGVLSEARSSGTSYDVDKAAKLWSDSEELVQLEAREQPRRIVSSAFA